MPNFESPALFIDFSRLPPPKVIEEIDYEALLQIYRDQVIEKSEGKLANAVALEQSPTNIILESEAYGEMIARARVNAAARAVMLPFATGTDLDNLAAFYNVARMALVATPRSFTTNPEDWETDERFRRRVQLSPEAFTTAGSEGAYIFHALSADVNLIDATAVSPDRKGSVRITIMRSGADPVPTQDQVKTVFTRLNSKNIRPLTDVVSVTVAKVINVDLLANLRLYPGPDSALVLNDVTIALEKVRSRTALLGRDLTTDALISALYQEGVMSVDLITPAGDITATPEQRVVIKTAKVNVLDGRAE